MEIGERGVNGAPAVRRANRENVPENGNAIHQLHSMVARNVKETQVMIKFATKMSIVQVNYAFVLISSVKQKRIIQTCLRLQINYSDF